MKKNKIRNLTGMFMIMLLLTGCGSSGMYSSGKDGYTTITFIDGIRFDVVSSVARNATAITNMSSDMAYETDQTYLYKDGESAYFIFNMESLVCIAQKGTTFHFSESADIKDSLENAGNILGVWFDCPKRKASSRDELKNGVYKCIVDANAQVSLTPDIYSDFSGQLTTIEANGEEWALYIGTKGNEGYEELSKDMKKTISYMVKSMSLYTEAPIAEESAPPVSLGGEDDVSGNSVEIPSPSPETSPSVEPSVEPSVTPEEAENVPEETEEISEEVVVEEVTAEPEEAEEAPSETPEPFVEPSEEPEVKQTATPTQEEKLEVTEVPVASPISRPETSSYIQQNNQKKVTYEDHTVYETDIYSMLQVGKKSRISMLCDGDFPEGVVKVTEVLTGKDAEQLIRKYCKNGTLTYAYFDAPRGCSWNVVHYFVEEGIGYVDTKLRGLDGENLRFRGIEYSQRTYDIPVSDKEFYSYYAVPNACPEYALEIGEGTISNELLSGYYHVKGN